MQRVQLNSYTKFITKNKQLLIGLLIGMIVVIPFALYALDHKKSIDSAKTISRPNSHQIDKSATISDSASSSSPSNSSTPTSTSNTNSAAPKTTTNTTTQTSPPVVTQLPPAQKQPYTFTFASGNLTSQWYAGGTFFPGNDYTDEWARTTASAGASGYNNWKFSYNCSSGNSCPTIILQASHDGSSWVNYRTYTASSGSTTFPVLYEYYRLLMTSGECSSNSCPPPTPPFPISYELSATGYYY